MLEKNILSPMPMNILMMSWVVSHLPHPHYQALMCSSGSNGYSAFRRSLEHPPSMIPPMTPHTTTTAILLTNIDLRDMDHDADSSSVDDATGGSSRNGVDVAAANKCGTINNVIGDSASTSSRSPNTTNRLFSIITNGASYSTTTIPSILLSSPLLNTTSTTASLDYNNQCIHMSVISSVTELPPLFLSGCGGLLASIDFSGVPYLCTLPSGFLEGCTGLTSLDFSSQSSSPPDKISDSPQHHHHHHLPHSFLKGCTGLTNIDLAGLCNSGSNNNNNNHIITELLFGFLEGCTSLAAIDLTPLSNVTNIGTGFMNGCVGLKSIDLSPLSKITQIPYRFLERCTGLTSIDFTPLEAITSPLPNGFLERMTGLSCVNFRGLGRYVTALPNGFMEGCTGFANSNTIDLSPFVHVTQLPINFLKGCSDLAYLDLSPLNYKMECIPRGFLSGCVGLESLTLMELLVVDEDELYDDSGDEDEDGFGGGVVPEDDVLPYEFLLGLTRLTSIDLSPLFRADNNSCDTNNNTTTPAMSSPPQPLHLMQSSSSPEAGPPQPAASIPPPGMGRSRRMGRRVMDLPWGMLHNCKSLKALDLSPLLNVRVRDVPNAFLKGCSGLTCIDVSPLFYSYSLRTAAIKSRSDDAGDDENCGGKSTNHNIIIEVPNGFLSGCTGITSIKFTDHSGDLVNVGRDERWSNRILKLPADLVERFRGLDHFTITTSSSSHNDYLPVYDYQNVQYNYN